MRFRVRNIDKYQHYKRRSPPWIKWHRECLHDREFMDLPDDLKWITILCVLLASETEDGIISVEDIEWRNRNKFSQKQADLLVASGMLAPCKQDASTVQAPCKQDALSETETETETEAETEILPRRKTDAGFVEWWGILKGRTGTNGARLKGSKKAALLEWKRLDLAQEPLDRVIAGTKAYQDATDYPKDAERILKHELWKQALEDAPVEKKPFVNRVLSPKEIAAVKAGRLKL